MADENFQELSLDHAVYRALIQSLELKIADDNVNADRNLVRQARLMPNPSLYYEVEDWGGNNQWKGWDNRGERYFYSQLFETANKRILRTETAKFQFYASLVGYDVVKLILLNRLTKAFISVAAAQEMLKLTQDQASIAKKMLNIATKKVEAGKVSYIEQNKAQVAYSASIVSLQRAETNFKNSKKKLSILWSESYPDFEKVLFSFYDIISPDTFEKCLTDLSNQVEVVQSLYTYLNAKKNWKLQKANAVPDVTLQVGYKANYREKNQGLLAGISFPIPLFNRNQGNIGKAYYDMLKTGDQGKQLWLILETRLSIFYEELEQSYKEAREIKNSALPAAFKAFELAQIGYREGKFEYLEVLDAQRTLFDVRDRYIQVLSNYHSRRADIDYINSQTD